MSESKQGVFIPQEISYIVTQGDSLCDPGKFARREWCACLSGLAGTSPDGRFTDGGVFTDYLVLALQTGVRPSELTDENIRSMKVNLADPDRVATRGARDCIRMYCEGGMTSADYSTRFTWNPVLAATEQIVSNLAIKRQHMLNDDRASEMRNEQRAETVVFELSGANDLITVNSSPTEEAAERAVQARIENVKHLIGKGYRHFVLLNLPDLSLTPRFQGKNEAAQSEVQRVVEYFNKRLKEEITNLQRQHAKCNTNLQHQHAECNIDLFDTNHIFTSAYRQCSSYGLDPRKLSQPYKNSPDFDVDSPSSAKGYMFWDDVHPTTLVHRHLADAIYEFFIQIYQFKQPNESLLENFRDQYARSVVDEEMSRGLCSFSFFKSESFPYKTADLPTILEKGIYQRDPRIHAVLLTLKWIDVEGNIIIQHPEINAAIQQVNESRARVRPSESWCILQ